jgi:hypothetical protein
MIMEGAAFADSKIYCHAKTQLQKELNNARVNRVQSGAEISSVSSEVGSVENLFLVCFGWNLLSSALPNSVSYLHTVLTILQISFIKMQ